MEIKVLFIYPKAFEEIEENEICGPGTDSTNVSNKDEMR